MLNVAAPCQASEIKASTSDWGKQNHDERYQLIQGIEDNCYLDKLCIISPIPV